MPSHSITIPYCPNLPHRSWPRHPRAKTPPRGPPTMPTSPPQGTRTRTRTTTPERAIPIQQHRDRASTSSETGPVSTGYTTQFCGGGEFPCGMGCVAASRAWLIVRDWNCDGPGGRWCCADPVRRSRARSGGCVRCVRCAGHGLVLRSARSTGEKRPLGGRGGTGRPKPSPPQKSLCCTRRLAESVRFRIDF